MQITIGLHSPLFFEAWICCVKKLADIWLKVAFVMLKNGLAFCLWSARHMEVHGLPLWHPGKGAKEN